MLILSAALLIVFTFPAKSVGAVSEAEARAEVDSAAADLDAATAKYYELAGEVERIDARIAETQRDITARISRTDEANSILNARLISIYKYSDLSALELVLGSQSLDDFTQRLELLSRLATVDVQMLANAKAARDDLERKQMTLVSEQASRRAALADLGAQRLAIEERLREREGELVSIQKVTVDEPSPGPSPPSGGKLTGHSEVGDATYYDDTGGYTCAHPYLPMGTLVRVTNVANGAQVWVEVATRGPWEAGRIIDLEEPAFKVLAGLSWRDIGVILVKVEW